MNWSDLDILPVSEGVQEHYEKSRICHQGLRLY